MPKLKLTPNQLLDEVMEQDLPAHVQTGIYNLVKSFDSITTQNKFLLMLNMSLMAEFDVESSENILEGNAKVGISRNTLSRITTKIESKKEKPIICYNEEGDDGFLRIKWGKADEEGS